MKRTCAIAKVGNIFWLLYSFIILSGCKPSGPPSYLGFTRLHSRTYYSNFAGACDKLMAKMAVQGTNEIQVPGNDSRLPLLLLDMHSSYIKVGSSQVWMVVDTYAAYGVIWQKSYLSSNRWELKVMSEAEPKWVFARTNR